MSSTNSYRHLGGNLCSVSSFYHGNTEEYRMRYSEHDINPRAEGFLITVTKIS